MDGYWKKIGEELAIKKKWQIIKFKKQQEAKIILEQKGRVRRRQERMDSKFENHEYAIKNKTRWPKGVSNVFNLLIQYKIRFEREKVVGVEKTFRQPDFAITKLKIFIEIDGPEHIIEDDKQREELILSREFYKNWKFFHIKPFIAADLTQCRIALKPIVDAWRQKLYDIEHAC